MCGPALFDQSRAATDCLSSNRQSLCNRDRHTRRSVLDACESETASLHTQYRLLSRGPITAALPEHPVQLFAKTTTAPPRQGKAAPQDSLPPHPPPVTATRPEHPVPVIANTTTAPGKVRRQRQTVCLPMPRRSPRPGRIARSAPPTSPPSHATARTEPPDSAHPMSACHRGQSKG
jgi:hypothetical protein